MHFMSLIVNTVAYSVYLPPIGPLTQRQKNIASRPTRYSCGQSQSPYSTDHRDNLQTSFAVTEE